RGARLSGPRRARSVLARPRHGSSPWRESRRTVEMMRMIGGSAVGLALSVCAAPASAQDTDVPESVQSVPQAAPLQNVYVPISPSQRVDWIVDGVVGRKSLAIGVVAATWQTAWNTPEERDRSWSGMGKRYAAREGDVAQGNTLEAGLGAIWGEEPRYIPSHLHGIGPRTKYAVKTVFLTQRRDGHLAPAWGRYVGNTVNNVIENAWLPPSITTPRETVIRSGTGFLTRLIGNMYDEFWPD